MYSYRGMNMFSICRTHSAPKAGTHTKLSPRGMRPARGKGQGKDGRAGSIKDWWWWLLSMENILSRLPGWKLFKRSANEVWKLGKSGPFEYAFGRNLESYSFFSGFLTAVLGSSIDYQGNKFVHYEMLLLPWIPATKLPDFYLHFKRKWLFS